MYWERENSEYAAYWGEAEATKGVSAARLIVPPLQEQGLQGKEWDTLQGSWDQWEALATGVKRVYEYQFQEKNPYVVGQSSTTRQHTTHHIFEQVSGFGMVVGGTNLTWVLRGFWSTRLQYSAIRRTHTLGLTLA